MAFQEVHVSQFISPTNCYTGCRHKDGFFATEMHSFHCSCKDGDTQVTAGPLPPPQEQCVGHDQSGAWELFSFLDASSVSEEGAQEKSAFETSSHHQRISQSSIASMETSSSSLPEAIDSPTQDAERATIAWLVLRSREEVARTLTASLTFRPLTPLLITSLDNHSEDERNVVACVGSADDSKLRCYIAYHDGNRQELHPVDLKESAFSFDSPVMVMDSLTTPSKGHTIAVGCQDGTVRIISFQYQRTGEALSFAKLSVHTILVDGPIIALHLSQQQGNTTHLVVGSMCGFVCRLQKTDESRWEGPWMVTEGLWNASLDLEDAVLAVHMLSKDMIALGTHSGKCFVWQQREAQDSYRLVWKCQLPYSIHGLSHVNDLSCGQPSLRVTTRFTFHVFQRDVPKYCADTAKRRLVELIKQRQTFTETDSLNAID